MRDAERPLPWRLNDLMTVYALNAAGFGGLLTAWYGAGGTVRDDRQVRWLILGIAALIVMGTANFLWLLAGRSAVSARKRAALLPIEALRAAGSAAATAVAAAAAAPLADDGSYLTIAGMRHYHRPTCQLVAGKNATRVTAAQAGRAGREPCGMCEP